MRTAVLGGTLGLFLASIALSQDATTDKRELRYRFVKGEKLTLTMAQKMNVKLDEVPEAFQGLAPEEPFDNAFEGEVAAEVKSIDDKGVATIEGKFQKIKAKGAVMGNEFDWAWDKAKDGEPKIEEGGDENPGIPGMGNPEDMLKQLALATLTLEIDPLGKIKVGGGGGAGQMAGQLLDLGGLIGQLPKDKVGAGDTWKNNDSLALPGLPLKMQVKSDNKFEKVDKVDGVECAVIQSKFTVGTSDEEDASQDLPIPVKAKFAGEGTGAMSFALDQGRPLRNEMKMEVKLTIDVPNPGGGDDIQIKGKFKLEQTLGVKKREF